MSLLRDRIVLGFARRVAESVRRESARARESQEETLAGILAGARGTAFGREHGLAEATDHRSFAERVPLRGPADYVQWVEPLLRGEADVLWPGRPVAFAYTSGTTSEPKYVPVTKESLASYMRSGRDILMTYVDESGSRRAISGDTWYHVGIPDVPKDPIAGVRVGRIDEIARDATGPLVRRRYVPRDFVGTGEEAYDEALDRVLAARVTSMSGILPNIQRAFARITERTGLTPAQALPDLALMLHGSVASGPYVQHLLEAFSRPLDLRESYPSTEGMIAFQDTVREPGMLLNLHGGIAFEFVPVEQLGSQRPDRLMVGEVETGRDYAVVLNSNAGLYGYLIGDLVRFVSTDPPRIVVSGRTRQFISLSGESIYASHVEEAMTAAASRLGVRTVEFTVAPRWTADLTPGLEWFVETAGGCDPQAFAAALDSALAEAHFYMPLYFEAGTVAPSAVSPVRPGGFGDFMASIGRAGPTQKVPRLVNDREFVTALTGFLDASPGTGAPAP